MAGLRRPFDGPVEAPAPIVHASETPADAPGMVRVEVAGDDQRMDQTPRAIDPDEQVLFIGQGEIVSDLTAPDGPHVPGTLVITDRRVGNLDDPASDVPVESLTGALVSGRRLVLEAEDRRAVVVDAPDPARLAHELLDARSDPQP